MPSGGLTRWGTTAGRMCSRTSPTHRARHQGGRRTRLRLNGIATIDESDELIDRYPGAQFIVRVAAMQVFPNCPRYIHRMELIERSGFVPRAERPTPIPDWKRSDWACEVLPKGDPA